MENTVLVKGIPIAHSASPIKEQISSGSDIYVWPYTKDRHRGQATEPPYKSLPQIVQEDEFFYELLAIEIPFELDEQEKSK